MLCILPSVFLHYNTQIYKTDLVEFTISSEHCGQQFNMSFSKDGRSWVALMVRSKSGPS